MATDWNAVSDEEFRAAFRELVDNHARQELRFMRKQRPVFDEVAIWYHGLAQRAG